MDEKLDYFKKKILAHLDDLEQKENAEKKELKKSLIAFEMASIEKAGYPVGTLREWKGKKYIKVAPGKWKPKYDSHSRGAKMAIAALKKKIDACTDSEELMQIILENRNRFSDENGRPLPFVKELSDYISGLNDKHEKGKIHSKQGNLNGKAQNADFSDFVDDFIKGGYKSDKIATLLNETPKILKDCGIPDNPITVTSTILKKILQDENNIYHGHNIAETVLKDLPNQLKNPVYVLKGKYGNKVIVTEHYVENRPVIAVLEIDRKQGRINVNSIRTVYDKKNDVFSQWISDKNNIDYENKEKSRALLQSIGLQSTEEATTPDNSNIPQNDKKSSGKSSLGKTYTGKDIVITNSTEASAKDAIAKAEFNNDLENPALFVPSNPALDKIIKTMQKKRYKGSEKRAFMSEFGTCGDGFLYVTNGIQLQRVNIDGIDGLGSGVSCLKVEKTNGGYKISELVGTDDNGNRETYRYPNCPRVIPDNKTSATLDNNALKNKLDELESKGYFSFDQWGTPTNKNSDKVKRVPIDFKADGVYIGNAKIGNNDNGVSDGRMFMNVDMLKESLSDGRNSIISVGDKTKAMSISSSVGDSVIMPMNPDDSEMPSTDDFENTEQGKAYAEAKAKWGSQKAAKKGMKKSFDLFGNEIKDLDSDEEEDSKDEMDSEDEIKKAVADVLDELAHGDK